MLRNLRVIWRMHRLATFEGLPAATFVDVAIDSWEQRRKLEGAFLHRTLADAQEALRAHDESGPVVAVSFAGNRSLLAGWWRLIVRVRGEALERGMSSFEFLTQVVEEWERKKSIERSLAQRRWFSTTR